MGFSAIRNIDAANSRLADAADASPAVSAVLSTKVPRSKRRDAAVACCCGCCGCGPADRHGLLLKLSLWRWGEAGW